MPMAKITPVGESGLYHVHFLDATDPGFGRPGGGHPDQGLPGRPPHVGGGPIYHPGHPDHGLPRQPGHPSHPIAGGGIPDNTLPSVPPPTLMPGYTLVLVRGPDGKWKYASVKPGVAPPIVLPEPIPPGGAPDQGLPPQPAQPIAGAPTPTPKA